MGHRIPGTDLDQDCRSAEPGHRSPTAGTTAELLADPASWARVTVIADPARQRLVLGCPSGTRWVAFHHGVTGLLGALRCPPGQLTSGVECCWHPGAHVLGLPADPRVSAGRAYVRLSPDPLGDCPLEHDAGLEQAFLAVTGTPGRR